MTEQVVPVTRTVVSMRDYARAVLRSWHLVAPGMLPKKQAVAVLWAQYMIETGGAACWNWNIGNVKHVLGDGYDYHMLKGTWEGVDKAMADALIAKGLATLDTNKDHIKAVAPRTAVVFQPPHPATWFRAYKSLDEAMHHHLVLLAKKRYASAWPHVVDGDFRSFAHALRARGYFTATAEAYARGMAGHYDQFMQSTVYENERDALDEIREAPTEPSPSRRPPVIQDFAIVHPTLEFPERKYDLDSDPDDPDDAA
jgi:hypothetical protein